MRRAERSVRLAVAALLVGLALGRADMAHAATFTVNPTQVFLSAAATSALISLRNESNEALRFQLTLRAWDQQPGGEMSLAPTQDLVFFPRLLTLAAGEERKVRVGLSPGMAIQSVERTYRIFIEELPPSQEQPQPQGVRVLTKMGIPIFVQPQGAAAKPSIDDVRAGGGRVRFLVRNAGNAHFVPDAVKVEGLDRNGRVLFSLPVKAWYVLAGGTRQFDLPIPAEPCGQVAAVTVTLRVDENNLVSRVETPAGPCRP